MSRTTNLSFYDVLSKLNSTNAATREGSSFYIFYSEATEIPTEDAKIPEVLKSLVNNKSLVYPPHLKILYNGVVNDYSSIGPDSNAHDWKIIERG